MKPMNIVFTNYRSGWLASFLLLWSGQAISMIASEIVQFSLIWWLTETYRSASLVGWATMMALLPRAVLNPVIGALVDQWNRKNVLLVSHIVILATMACLGILFLQGAVAVGWIFSAIFICAVSKSFQSPALLSTTILIIPERYVTRVSGSHQTLMGLIRVIAPSAGAILIMTIPMGGVVIFDVVGALIGVLTIAVSIIPNLCRPVNCQNQQTGTSKIFIDILEGVRYIRKWPGAMEMMAISSMINFLSTPAFMMISILVFQFFRGSEGQFGLISSAIGVGMIVGGIFLSLWSGFKKPMVTSLTGVLIMATALVVIGIVPNSFFWLAVICMFAGGCSIPLCMAPIQAIVQKQVNPKLQGRILTLLDWISTLISPISLALATPFFDNYGPQFWYIGSGILAFVIGMCGLFSEKTISFGVEMTEKPISK